MSKATKEDVMRFARAMWPQAPDLALASFDEKKALNDAADRIAELEQSNTAISHLLKAQGLYIKELEGHMKDKERIDWLEMMANKPAGILLHSEVNSTGRLGLGLAMPTRSLRDAIDQAMEFRD